MIYAMFMNLLLIDLGPGRKDVNLLFDTSFFGATFAILL